MTPITSVESIVAASLEVAQDLQNPDGAAGPRVNAILLYLRDRNFMQVDEHREAIVGALRNFGQTRSARAARWLVNHTERGSSVELLWKSIAESLEAEAEVDALAVTA